MNFKVEEILMVVIAFLIGWFLSNMIPGSSLGSGLRVKAVGGKHDATVGEIHGDKYIPQIDIQKHLSDPGLGGSDKKCNDVPYEYRMAQARLYGKGGGPNMAFCNTMFNSDTNNRCTQAKVEPNHSRGWQWEQEQKGQDEQCIEGGPKESPIECSKLNKLDTFQCSQIYDNWIKANGKFHSRGPGDINDWNQDLCQAFYEKRSGNICKSGGWNTACATSNNKCIK